MIGQDSKNQVTGRTYENIKVEDIKDTNDNENCMQNVPTFELQPGEVFISIVEKYNGHLNGELPIKAISKLILDEIIEEFAEENKTSFDSIMNRIDGQLYNQFLEKTIQFVNSYVAIQAEENEADEI